MQLKIFFFCFLLQFLIAVVAFAGLPNAAYLGQKNAFQLRLTGSVEQPLSRCDLLDAFEAVNMDLRMKALRDAPQCG